MGGPATNQNGQIQRRAERPGSNLAGLLESMKGEIARALPKHLTPDRMARVALTALRTTKGLVDCTPASFAASIMTCSQLGLEPNTPLGHAYLIPRQNRRAGIVECTLMIGYQGFIELARRSGQVRSIWAYPVYEGDDFTVKYGLAPTIEHSPRFDGPRTPKTMTHVYAAAKLRDTDEPVFVVLTKREVEGYRARGQSGGAWDTDYEAMALKTAVRRLYRWLPKSIELATALRVDEAPESGRSQLEVVGGEIRDALHRQGLDLPPEVPADVPIDTTAETQVDPETGEARSEDEPPSAA